MVVIFAGIVTFVSNLHPAKASFLIVVTLLLILTDFNFVQFLNAALPITVSVST